MFLVLHPCHKLEYFKKQKWEIPWIQDACKIVCHEFVCSYTPAAVCSQRDDVQVANCRPVSYPNSHLFKPLTLFFIFQSTNIFDHLPNLAPMSSELCDELNCYLATDIEDTKDPLKWWYEQCWTFPHLALMAHNYLSIPGKAMVTYPHTNQTYKLLATTVDVERVFSQGWLILSHVQSHLSIQSTRALLCLGAWCQHGLVKGSHIKSALGDEVISEESELSTDWDAIHRHGL
jgi:hypothetical protein